MNRLHRALLNRPAGTCARRKVARAHPMLAASATLHDAVAPDQGDAHTQASVAIHGLLAHEAGPTASWIFVDESLRDADAWLAPLQGEVVHLDPSRPGLEQIAGWLQGVADVQTVHILSQGLSGQLTLGSSVLDMQSLSHQHADALAVIAGALAPQADLHLHGVDLAADAAGAAFIEALASIIGADVTASDQARAAASDLPSRDVEVRTLQDTPVHGAVGTAFVEGASIAFCIGSVPLHGMLMVHSDGAWTYTPDSNFHGQDAFTIVVLEGRGIKDTVAVQVAVVPAGRGHAEAGDHRPGHVVHMSRVACESRLADGFREAMAAFPTMVGGACAPLLVCATQAEACIRAALLSAFQSASPGHAARLFDPLNADAGLRVAL